jgi:hypothetical protein
VTENGEASTRLVSRYDGGINQNVPQELYNAVSTGRQSHGEDA